MKKNLLAVLMMFASSIVLAQQVPLRQTIKGTIIDEQSGNVLHGATIITERNDAVQPGISDSLGNFKLINVPIGRQSIRVSLSGYDETAIRNIEVTSSKEVVLEIKMKERIKKLDEVIVKGGKQKNSALNEAAVVSARQFSVDEALRYAGTRNDPSRMAQNFAGVSGSNDARNDIIIRGNSPAGVLWRMEGIDIPNPNHYSTLGSTGGPVTILNTNTLKNSDFITSAFPAQYGNAVAGVFDLRMRNGNNEKYEFLGQAGFNGFEFGAEGPLKEKTKSSFLINYRYSLVAVIQKFGLDVGTGSATPYYQDINFKLNIPTEKWGTISLFGVGGESHIKFAAVDKDNLYATNDGSLRNRNFRSLTGVTGLTHTYFFNSNTSGKIMLAVSGFDSKYQEDFYNRSKPGETAFYKKNTQVKYSAGYTFNKKFSSKNQLTAGVVADFNKLKLRNDHIPDGDSVLTTFFDTKKNAVLVKGFVNFGHRFSDKFSTNLGVYHQLFTLNNTKSIEPRWNIKYQFRPNQSLSFGAGLHSQSQPLEVYFYETRNAGGENQLTNRELKFVKSVHNVLGYDINISRHLRLKT
ncbi:MAG: carboxypeptidase regulatory-like domain-containing protein, partial [Ginsengibacter sp.]